jgi:hypothetical protein
VTPTSEGSRLDADHPANGVLIPRRYTPAFSLAPPLGSTGSVTAEAALFARFFATMGRSDFSIAPISATAPGLPETVPATAGGDGDGDLPVPVQKTSAHARVYDDAGSAGVSRKRRRSCCLLLVRRTSAPRICLSPLNT